MRCESGRGFQWRHWLVALSAVAFLPSLSAYQESPMLTKLVAGGELPPVEARLPVNPRVVEIEGPGREIGRYGGDLRLLMGRAKDVRLMVVYGYARLVGYNEQYDIVPDLLESVDNEGDRQFTLHLRQGHRWSDGMPFTSEDFRFYWDDLANNEYISPVGVTQPLLVDGKPPRVEIIDATTVRYSWDAPNPFFLPALAGTLPLSIYAPAHYLKQFHATYADPAQLEAIVRDSGQSSWAALLNNMNRDYKNTNPDLPSLQPWVLKTRPPSQRFVFSRNAYYHRVDQAGNQLPYIDKVVMNIADGKLIAAKTAAGETNLQARHLSFTDYTFLRQNEQRSDYDVYLWGTTKGSHIALFPNLNVVDETFRKLFRDVRFRRAMSLAIDRGELNQILYFGLAVEGNNTVNERCPFYSEDLRTRWAEYDPETANALLDEMGLTERDSEGTRLLPDGRPLTLIVETAGEDTEQVDVLELIHDAWLNVGIKLFTKPLQREVFRNRVFSGDTMISIWGGLENGLPTPSTSPQEIAPTQQLQLQWPKWGQYVETKGVAGEAPDLESANRLVELNNAWLVASGDGERTKIWREMLEIFADQVFTIGLIAGVPQPVVVSHKLRNVPKDGVYNWDPGAHFGIYFPDTFWFSP